MFELEKAIADWRQRMVAAGLKRGEALDELESHLRDDIQREIQAGLTTQQAFESASERIGGARALKSEFAKIGRTRIDFLSKLKSFLMGHGSIALPSLSTFTSSAQQTLELARAEAPRLNHDFIGTEHVLLGLLGSQSGILTNIMRRMGIDTHTVRKEIETLVGPGLPAQRVAAEIPYTPRATRALALAVAEAEALQQTQVCPEHIFLGLVKEGEGVAALVLRKLGVDIKTAREQIVKELGLGKTAG